MSTPRQPTPDAVPEQEALARAVAERDALRRLYEVARHRLIATGAGQINDWPSAETVMREAVLFPGAIDVTECRLKEKYQ